MSGLRGINYGTLKSMIYGDGNDGNVVVTGTLVIVRDMRFNNLTVNPQASINTNGYRIRVREILDLQGSLAAVGTISNNGNNGYSATGGVAEVSSSVPPGTPGAASGTLAGGGRGGAGMYNGGYNTGGASQHTSSVGGPNVPAVDLPAITSWGSGYTLGGHGGAGGDYFWAGDPGAAPTPAATLNVIGRPHGFFTMMTGFVVVSGSDPTGSIVPIVGGGGGGAGGCLNSGSIGSLPRSGWGGGGGGVVYIAAAQFNLNGEVHADGGNGGNTFGQAGAGGGGGGGVVILAFSTMSFRIGVAGQVFTNGGQPGSSPVSGGLPYSSGNLATTGSNGTVLTFEI